MKNMSIPNLNVTVTWTNIEWLRKLTQLPIICKGILSPIDTKSAIKYGANGIIISNHGGRLTDTAPPAIQCLEDVVNAMTSMIQKGICSDRVRGPSPVNVDLL
ncbi:unnamed protein product [Rotaria sordida]|uniref:FMN hydroxy acid dehydrogenase domain-containing protein n=1 Tax=Rotaria sordida TaxID=392033 RepID=A0A819YMS2_9BILA|nr:unnamed protein product [Rotaria sordida]